MNNDKPTHFAALIGLDWGDQFHAIALLPTGGTPQTSTLPHSAESLHQWLDQLEKTFGGRPVALAVEASRGPVVYALQERPWITIYPVHPATSTRQRSSFRPSGAKDDTPDALVLLHILQYHRDRLRPLQPDDEMTRTLARLVEARRKAVDRRSHPLKDEHQVMALWLSNVVGGYVNAGADRVIDLEVACGAFETPDLAFEGEASDGRYPTGHIYFGRAEDFLIHRTDAIQFERPGANAPIDPATGESYDTGRVRYLRTPVGKPKRIQQVSDAAQVTYDRDGTSMCPDGTFSRDWGSRVLSTAEQFDFGVPGAVLEDLDEALGQILAGTAAAEQSLVAEDVDLLLGAVTGTNSNRYAP